MRDAPTKLRMHTEYLIHVNHDTIDRGNLTSKGARPVDPVTTELGLVREHANRYTRLAAKTGSKRERVETQIAGPSF